MTKIIKRTILAILVMAIGFNFAGETVAQAATATVSQTALKGAAKATSHPSYGYTYAEASSHKTNYRFYDWNVVKKAYQICRDFYSKNSKLYFSNKTKVDIDILGEGAEVIGFDDKGNLYVGAKDTSLKKIDTSNKITTVISAGFVRLNYNIRDTAVSAKTTSGTVSLSTLKPIPDVDDEEILPQKPKSPNRLEIGVNSANETVITSYQNNKVKLKLVVSANEKKVLNQTSGIRLTDMLIGAKFISVDTDNNVYLYETDCLLMFEYGKWFSPKRISLYGKYTGFRTDDNNYLSTIITSKSEYSIDQLVTSDRWKATSTYVISKPGYKTLYTKGSSASNTLSLKAGVLRLNGKKIKNHVVKYEFFDPKSFTCMLSNGRTYTATIKNPTKLKLLCRNGKDYKKNKNKLATKAITKSGKSLKLK